MAYIDVGKRIRERLLSLAYVRPDGQPDVQRFCWDHRYDRTLVYAWLADKATPFKDLIRLARDLDVSVEWLLTGQERLPGKAPRRQGRRGAGKLLLVLSLGAASALAWPSEAEARGGVLDQGGTVAVGTGIDTVSLLGRCSWVQILRDWLASLGTFRAVFWPVPCPA